MAGSSTDCHRDVETSRSPPLLFPEAQSGELTRFIATPSISTLLCPFLDKHIETEEQTRMHRQTSANAQVSESQDEESRLRDRPGPHTYTPRSRDLQFMRHAAAQQSSEAHRAVQRTLYVVIKSPILLHCTVHSERRAGRAKRRLIHRTILYVLFKKLNS